MSCSAADAMMDAYVRWNEACLLPIEVSGPIGLALDSARLAHDQSHAHPWEAWDCVAEMIRRRGWPHTVWQHGHVTTTWKEIEENEPV